MTDRQTNCVQYFFIEKALKMFVIVVHHKNIFIITVSQITIIFQHEIYVTSWQKAYVEKFVL